MCSPGSEPATGSKPQFFITAQPTVQHLNAPGRDHDDAHSIQKLHARVSSFDEARLSLTATTRAAE